MEDASVKVGARRVALTNLDKVLYPAGRFTKAKALDYYRRVAPVLLPHFRGRPVTLVRFPDGVFGEPFYEKNAPGFTPRWVKTFPVPRTDSGVINYVVINDLPSLIWAVDLAALELHPFLHRVPDIDRPTCLVFDLDPGEHADLLACCEVALLVRETLAKLKLICLAKVSGAKGLQVYVPLNTPVTYSQTRAFACASAELLAKEHPDRIVSDMPKSLRTGKVFIDWSQNHPTKTTVGVYSLRAKRERPLVSMPVTWQEVRRALRRNEPDSLVFSPQKALERIRNHGDLFLPLLRLKQHLPEQFVKAVKARLKVPESNRLAQYAARRNFSRTNEPEAALPRRSAQGSRRRFVVQKHAARQLHYDFRLEMHEVLKSWAVPKGVPLLPGHRRSAFATEDHPLDYLRFEGNIPEGEYGGGTVMVWDIGTYEPVAGHYYQGEVTVYLTGKKLKGRWTLKRLKPKESKGSKDVWLLMKTGGAAAPILSKKAELSALTGRTMAQIAEQQTAVWHSNRVPASAERHKPSPATRRARAPKFIPPMKATLVDHLPEGPEWIYEIKWDGYRALAVKHGPEVRLLSLKNKDLNSLFPSIVAAVRTVPAGTALIDGEIVAVDSQGRPSFQALQNRVSLGRDWQVVYYAFDLLNLEGEDLRALPLSQRKERLKDLVEGTGIRFSADLRGVPEQIAKLAKRNKLEGIVAKRKESTYTPGTRSLDWRKRKLSMSQEFVIGGYNPDGKTFSSLLAGYYHEHQLMFAGKVRQGLNPASRASLMKHLQPLRVNRCPFVNLPTSKTSHFGEGITREDMPKLHWLRPKLVAQVSFTEWTDYALLRHATFMGLRTDKRPTDVLRETPALNAEAP